MEDFAENINIWADDLQQHGEDISYEQLAEHMTALRGRIPTKTNTMWQSYITEATKDLIKQRDEAARALQEHADPTEDMKARHKALKMR